MGSANGMIAQARKSIGTGESPANTNYITRWYGMNGQPWCDMSITYWAHKSGNAAAVCPNGPHGSKNAYAYTVWHAGAFNRLGRFHYGTAGIRAGDIIFYNWGGTRAISLIDHVGLVERVSGGTIHTIEGNRSDRCGRFIADHRFVVGYGRPAYSGGGKTSNGGKPAKEKEEMPERVNAAWYGNYTLPADDKWHTMVMDKVYADSYSQRAKNGKRSSTVMSSAGTADVTVHLTFEHLEAGGVQIRLAEHKGKKIVNHATPVERPGTAGKSFPDGSFVGYSNHKGHKMIVQVKNTSGQAAKLTAVNTTANIWPAR